MIKSLDLAFNLHARLSTREFFVTEDVFREVLSRSRADGTRQFLRLNAAYNSFVYRFINKVAWNGMVFICATNQRIYEEDDVSWLVIS